MAGKISETGLFMPEFVSRDNVVFDAVPGGPAPQYSPILTQMLHKWNPEYYRNERAPLHVGSVVCRDMFSQRNDLLVFDMPVKFPGSSTYRVPGELSQFEEVIKKIAAFETTINPNVRNYYAYITIDQRPVLPRSTQRVQGVHVDGLQGKNVVQKVPVEQTYIVSDALTTTVYPQAFDFSGKSVNQYNWFRLMEQQVDKTKAVQGDPYEIYLIDPYTVHAGTMAVEACARTFLRMEYSLRQYDRQGNSHNPLFDYSWQMVDRPVSMDLI